MKRLGIVLAVLVTVLAAASWFLPSPATVGQDQTDERLAALETQVADQSSDVSNLKKRVRVLETAVAGIHESGAAAEPGADEGTAPEGAIVLRGVGKQSTEPLDLNGAYTVAGTCDVGGYFSLDTINVTNPDSFEFVNLNGETPFDGSVVTTFEGRYAFTVNCDGDWTLTFTPLS